MLVTYCLDCITPSGYQSDAICTKFDHEIDIRLNLRQKALKNLNSNTSGVEGILTSNLGAKDQASETFLITSDLMLIHQKWQP